MEQTVVGYLIRMACPQILLFISNVCQFIVAVGTFSKAVNLYNLI